MSDHYDRYNGMESLFATDNNVGTKLGTNCISREQAIKVVQRIIPDNRANGICEELKKLPPIQPKRGKWIKTARWGRVYYCNQCRNYLDFDGVNAGRGSTNFCPNCGADMRGEQDG